MLIIKILLTVSQVSFCSQTPLSTPINYQKTRQNLIEQAKSRPLISNTTKTSLGYLAICTVGKNELGIKEWIQYHLYKGVDKIYLFDNGSKPPMIEKLHDFLDSDKLDYFYYKDTYKVDDYGIQKMYNEKKYKFSQGNNFQVWAYASCMRWFGHRHKFVAIFDLDEFLVLDNLTQTFPEFLKDYENFGGLKVYRRFFGSSGHVKKPKGTVLQSYTKCTENIKSYEQQQVPKQIVNMDYFNGFCAIHWCKTTIPSVNSDMVEETQENLKSGAYKKSFKGIHFNHYFLKSLEELKYKWVRKFGAVKSFKPEIQKTFHQWFDELDNLAQADCFEGIELSKQCCANLTT